MTGEASAPGQDQSADEARANNAGPSPSLEESLRQLGATGRATLGAGSDAAKALRILVAADISLARSAFGRTLAMTAAAIVFGASAWLLLMAALITFLSRQLGVPWSLALLISAGLSLATAAASGWLSMRYFEHTRMKATRRQLARLGIGELAGFMPDAESGRSSHEGAKRVAQAHDAGGAIKKGLGVDITEP